ncbi:MAG: DUF262 domain-containing protein [Candidatus Cryptobacteroides sp.]|nr:DUF262 domain-containing protein [Candidatus Cryptobacteroides sp.]
MKIELNEISVRDLTAGYYDSGENGVRGFHGKLDIRPAYQREFVYNDKQREAVITTIKNHFPLNVMYWAKRDDDTFEVIDGQQRTISVCQYVNGDFSYDFKFFENLTKEEQDEILDYKLMVYICEGTDKEKLDWFRVINIAGVKLTDQELRNAVYSGSFVTDAKRYFSKPGCPAYKIASDIMSGSAIRQDYLETAIEWIANSQGIKTVEQYMAIHQHDPNCNQLWQYFNAVITWVYATFDVKRWKKIMNGVNWGVLYDEFKDKILDKNAIADEISRLIIDSEVGNSKGICVYVLTRNENVLNLRAFPEDMKLAMYERQNGICPICKKHFDIQFMEADHIIAWSKGGKTVLENGQMLCRECNRHKSDK